jgi:hypothetical protein
MTRTAAGPHNAALDQPLSESRAARSMLHPWPHPAAGTQEEP